MVTIQKQNARWRFPLFSVVWSRVTGCLASEKTFGRLKMRPSCLETSGTNHPVTQSHNAEETSLRKPPAGVLNSRGRVERTDGQTQSSNGTEFTKLLVLSGCPVFRISSALVKFHVLSLSLYDVRIPLRPQPPHPHCYAHSAPTPLPRVLLPKLTHGALNELLSLSLSGPVPLLARFLNTEETNKYQL
jgi:hypothetical protein